MIQERLEWIDLCKGIGIIIVVLGHVSLNESFSLYIHSFHMPLFFVVSGYLYNLRRERSVKTYLVRKTKTLIMPYFVFGLSTYLFWLFIYRNNIVAGTEDALSPLKHLLWINTTGLKISGEFWFLTALFFASISFDLLNRGIENRTIRFAVVLILAVVGCFFRRLFDAQLPWALLPAFVGIGFMYIGFQIKTHQDDFPVRRLFDLKWRWITVVVVLISCLVFLNGEVNMRRSLYSNVPLFWFNATVLSLLLLVLCRKIENYGYGRLFTITIRLVKNVGKDSIVYLCLDSFVLKALSAVARKFVGSNVWQNAPFALVEAGAAVFILYCLNIVIQKTRLRCLFGK